MKITDIAHAEKVLQEYVPHVATYSGDGMSLDRMWPLLEAAGNPHQQLSVVHIAGTSGKTSTAYYTAALLQSTGARVGLTVSPHVDSVTERVQINGRLQDEAVFCRDLGEFIDLIADVTPQPTYFELLIVFVLWSFVRHGVDYAVLETGMGGLVDGTNVVTRTDKVCAITDIGLDHTHILGTTIPEIARQKAGIIHEGNHVFMHEQSDAVMDEVRERASHYNAPLHVINEADTALSTPTEAASSLADFQIRNSTLARAIAEHVAARDGRAINADFDLNSVVVPGRMEVVQLSEEQGSLVMDGAHNRQKMQAFVSSFQTRHPDTKADVLLALKEGKEYKEVIDELAAITHSLIVTTFNTSQDLPAVSQSPDVIADYARSKDIDVTVAEDNKQAYSALRARQQPIKIATGSFYLLHQLRKLL